MNIQQINNLKKIMGCFEKDYRITEQLNERHAELIDSIRLHQMADIFDTVLHKGVRREVLEQVKECVEFEELLDSYRREMMGVIAKWDLADQLDSARDAA